MKVTEEMIKVFGEAWEKADDQGTHGVAGVRRRAGLEAVLAHLLPAGDGTMGALGKASFERYAESMEGRAASGAGIPPWDAMGEREQEAWMAAAWVPYMLGYEQGKTVAA